MKTLMSMMRLMINKFKIDIDLNIIFICKSIRMALRKIQENPEAFRINIRKELDKVLENEKN